ncbi:MAG TPA: hypothetical protein DCP91_11590 [Eggerthellaceae bacterium]|nr:hypothetical protein [Eggerthellaceae bacterium]
MGRHHDALPGAAELSANTNLEIKAISSLTFNALRSKEADLCFALLSSKTDSSGLAVKPVLQLPLAAFVHRMQRMAQLTDIDWRACLVLQLD